MTVAVTVTMAVAVVVVAVASSMLEVLGILALTFFAFPCRLWNFAEVETQSKTNSRLDTVHDIFIWYLYIYIHIYIYTSRESRAIQYFLRNEGTRKSLIKARKSLRWKHKKVKQRMSRRHTTSHTLIAPCLQTQCKEVGKAFCEGSSLPVCNLPGWGRRICVAFNFHLWATVKRLKDQFSKEESKMIQNMHWTL